MGAVGSLIITNEENSMKISQEQLSSIHSSMKTLRLVAKRLEHGRVKKFRSNKIRNLKLNHVNLREQLKRQVEALEIRQNQLLSTVEQLRLYKKELEVICQQRIPLKECQQ